MIDHPNRSHRSQSGSQRTIDKLKKNVIDYDSKNEKTILSDNDLNERCDTVTLSGLPSA